MSSNVDILLVEDNPSDAELTMWALRKNGMGASLLHLQNGEAALEYLFGKGAYVGRNMDDMPKIVLMDLKMPKVGGLEVLRAMKDHDRTRRIPVVLLTSSKEERDIREAYHIGANSYVVKPVEFDDLVRMIAILGTYWLQWNQTAH